MEAKLDKEAVARGQGFNSVGDQPLFFPVYEVGRRIRARQGLVDKRGGNGILPSEEIDGQPGSNHFEPTRQAAAPVAFELAKLPEIVFTEAKKKILMEVFYEIVLGQGVMQSEGFSDRMYDRRARSIERQTLPTPPYRLSRSPQEESFLFRSSVSLRNH